MLQQLLKVKQQFNLGKTVQIVSSIFVGSYMDGKTVSQIPWPNGSLLTKIVRNGIEIVPSGQTLLRWGDTLYINVSTKNQHQITSKLTRLSSES